MTSHEHKRHCLMGRLSRRVIYTTPMLLLLSGPFAAQAMADNTTDVASYTIAQSAAPLMASAEGEAEAEGEGEGEGEAESGESS
ncbi:MULTISPECIES: hypothetical protein [Modicisalibacter]|uniref:Uncharacterized protein n=1 Tax=Modicisalibacter tunisiensis TaxID=390637 RepID=A0ABS7WWI9_9GAMM|nr:MULTISPECIES: hypothetical protein [Modicisalibacter]MBZ9539634.1 hypothetical protein [Modicisalibacter tunisiensis]MBZ9566965.1 hypothetical protein [Modicisalibacter tunisiensis]